MSTERNIIEITSFSRKIDQFLEERKVFKKNFDDFKKSLAQDPKQGDLITGTGGFLMKIYPKNEPEDLSADEKKSLKEFSNMIKRR